MSSMQRRGLNNSLIHWVHRHDRMATLFRSSVPDTQTSFSARHVVSASIAPFAMPPSQKTMEQEAMTESSAEYRRGESTANPSPVQLTRAEAPQPSKTTATHKPLPSKSSDIKQAPQEDHDWRRLQAILRKHEEQTETDPPSNFEPTPSQKVVTNKIQPLSEQKNESLKTQRPGPRATPAVYRQSAARTATKPVDTPVVTNSTSEGIPPILPTSPSEVEYPQPEDQKQNSQTIQLKSEASTETKSIDLPQNTVSQVAPPTSSAVVQKKERSNLQQQVLKGLRSIFRKHQESSGIQTPTFEARAAPVKDSTQEELSQPSHSPQANLTNEPSPFQKETAEPQQRPQPIKTSTNTVLSSKPVQHAAETRDNVQTPPAMSIRSQRGPSLLQPGSFDELVSPESDETADEPRATDQIQRQTIPLQSAWNVQRIDVDESPAHESSVQLKTNPLRREELMSFDEFDRDIQQEFAHEQVTSTQGSQPTRVESNVSASDEPLSESIRMPVEILSPSRPRPTRASIVPSNPTVQRQREKENDAPDAQEPATVDTAIGPLPSDLWTLLGQKPPAGTREQESQRQASLSFNGNATSQTIQAAPRQQSSKPEEIPVHHVQLPDAIQRAPASTDLATSSSPEQTEAAQDKNSFSVESDINDLARKVYAEVRHRLAMEWERMRR